MARVTCPVALAAVVVLAVVAHTAAEEPSTSVPILPLEKVRVGMLGYGLSVFQGTQIEPFPVEVVTVKHNYFFGLSASAPRRSAIWIRCTDARMKEAGPVAGMSGSPIYVWQEGEPHRLGRGGRLIGAFAFGFPASKECYVGVEPIEQMLDLGRRTKTHYPPGIESTEAGGSSASVLLGRLLEVAQIQKTAPINTWRAQALADLFRGIDRGLAQPGSAAVTPPPPDGHFGEAVPLATPVTLSSPTLCRAMAPVMELAGMIPVAGRGRAGAAPPWIKSDRVRLEAGSVLSIPLVYGDIDIAASGTVTDVLSDGKVLAFGHGIGMWAETPMPMATGYVDFVLPGPVGAFKVGGSAQFQGAIVHAENSGVVGLLKKRFPDVQFQSVPVEVAIIGGDLQPMNYEYQVIKQKNLTAVYSAIVVAESLTAIANLPIDNTIRLRSQLNFEGDRTIAFDTMIPKGSALDVVFTLLPPLAALALNPFETILLETATVEAHIESQVRLGTIIHGRIDHAELAPGDTLGISVRIQKYGGEPFEKRIELKIPETVSDGDYEVVICDAPTYLSRLLANRPHLTSTTSGDDLFDVVSRITTVASDAIYVLMDLPNPGLAVGQHELLWLPSSRMAMMATATSTLATPFRDWIAEQVPIDLVTVGSLKFKIVVERTRSEEERQRAPKG